MALKLPADIVRGHPGQVFSVTADVKLNLLYNGFFVDAHHQLISAPSMKPVMSFTLMAYFP